MVGLGLLPGDLDPGISPHHLTTHKAAYLKLRALVDAGCTFVGHGLKQDFRMINIFVPPAQVSAPQLAHLCTPSPIRFGSLSQVGFPNNKHILHPATRFPTPFVHPD